MPHPNRAQSLVEPPVVTGQRQDLKHREERDDEGERRRHARPVLHRRRHRGHEGRRAGSEDRVVAELTDAIVEELEAGRGSGEDGPG